MSKRKTTPPSMLTQEALASVEEPKSSTPIDVDDALPKKSQTSNKQLKYIHPSQQYVDHTYNDYANVSEDALRLLKLSGDEKGAPTAAKLLNLVDSQSKNGPTKSKSNGSGIRPFQGKLLEVLDRGDLTAIVDWLPHGRAFIVKQPHLFTSQVLPRFFKQTKFMSFVRQLNLWGFKRITAGQDVGAYYHELFLPGRPKLALRMMRHKVKGTGIRPLPNPAQEPNFYTSHPPVPRVSRTREPLPLLRSERMAGLAQSVDPAAAALQHQVQPMMTESSYMPQIPSSTGADFHDIAATQASRGFGFRQVHNQGLISGLSSTRNSIFPQEPSFAQTRLDPNLASSLSQGLYNISAAAPRGFVATEAHEDAVSAANRRLMERLLNQTECAPIEKATVALPSVQAMLPRRGNDAAHSRGIAAPSTERRVSIPSSFLPQSEGINIHTHSSALSGADYLEELERRQSAMARALEEILRVRQNRRGHGAHDSLPLGTELDETRGGEDARVANEITHTKEGRHWKNYII